MYAPYASHEPFTSHESFKGGSRIRKTTGATGAATTGAGAATGTATGAIAALAIGGATSGAGGTTITSCPPGDESMYCKFVKGFNIFKMIVFILTVLGSVYFVIKMLMVKR
jgi:hypothetical protein